MATTFTRRQSLHTLGLTALAYALPVVARATPHEPRPAVQLGTWLERLHANAARLRSRKISGLQWQEMMDDIYADTPLGALQDGLDFVSLRKQILDRIESEKGELFYPVRLPGQESDHGVRSEPHRTLIAKVAHIKRGRSIPPHGHSNMASAFLCLSGEFAVKQYDKLEEKEQHLVLRQTVDTDTAGVGTWSSISDYRNNVHWLTAKTNDCFLFTCKLIGIESDRKLNGRINVDVRRGDHLGRQTIRAPKITAAEAAAIY